ncbi:SPL family radical SAM protein [Thermogladius sp. 4427co]|uniref:SPL family radical SAM protein n=1 Tax=Thermogladius sp. 4427co TaxID=3450718 RepID=UPI003F7B332A
MSAIKVIEIKVSKAISKSGLPDLDYALNPYLGCYHGCIYCYARLYTRIKEVSMNWGEVVGVKINLVEKLEKEVKYLTKGIVGVGTITDPYQPVEAKYFLTRESLKILFRHGFKASIQTKGTLVTRDIDLLSSYSNYVDVGFTITTLDPKKASFIEPKAPPPSERVKALERVSSEKIRTWIFIGPIIPGLNDDIGELVRIIEIASSTGSDVYYDSLHVKPFMRENHPLSPYSQIAVNYNWRILFDEIEKTCREKGVNCKPGFTRNENFIPLTRYFNKNLP